MIRNKSNNVLDLNQIINFTKKKKKLDLNPYIFVCVCMYYMIHVIFQYDTIHMIHTHIYIGIA